MAINDAVLGACIRPSIHDPVTGDVLANAVFSFFKRDKVTRKNIYVTPDRITLYDNPLTLDSIGSEPPIYYDTDEEYWVEIRRPASPDCECESGDLLYSFFFYPDSLVKGSNEVEINNFVANGQFKYPIPFSKTNTNKIEELSTFICQSWELEVGGSFQDNISVEFLDAQNDDIEGNPINFFKLSIESSQVTQCLLKTSLGMLARLKGEAVTLSLNGEAINESSIDLNIIIRQIFGSSQSTDTTMGSITLTNVRSSHFLNFTIPDVNSGSIIHEDSQVILMIQYPLNAPSVSSITNVQLEKGTISNPTYVEEVSSISDAKCFFGNFFFPNSSSNDPSIKNIESYDRLIYDGDNFRWYRQAGQFAVVNSKNIPADMEVVSGQSVKRTDYSVSGIPYQRLFDAWGSLFGSSGNFISTSSNEVVTIEGTQGKENSPFDIQTYSSYATLEKVTEGLKLGIYASIGTSSNIVNMKFFDKFTIRRNPDSSIESLGMCQIACIGWWKRLADSGRFVQIAEVNPGSPSAAGEINATFTKDNVYDYATRNAGISGYPSRIFEFASKNDPNFRGNFTPGNAATNSPMLIKFTIDGDGYDFPTLMGKEATTSVNFTQSKSLAENLIVLMNAINNNFVFHLTFTAVPAAGSYFFVSSPITNIDDTATSKDFLVWARVDGQGTEPSVSGRTNIAVDFSASDDLNTIAKKHADVLNSETFSFPQQSDFATLSNSNLKWATYL